MAKLTGDGIHVYCIAICYTCVYACTAMNTVIHRWAAIHVCILYVDTSVTSHIGVGGNVSDHIITE